MKVRSTILMVSAGMGLLLGATRAVAQDHWCGTDEATRQRLQANPQLAQEMQERELWLQDFMQARRGQGGLRDDVVYYIPVVFHVLRTPYQYQENLGAQVISAIPSNAYQEDISADIIRQNIELLNDNMRRRNHDQNALWNGYNSISPDVKIEFRLATIDPYGNCTDGINRISTLRSDAGGQSAKKEIWLRERYLNIWVIRTMSDPGVAGFSQKPGSVNDNSGALIDGVLLTQSSFRAMNGTLTHEVGHWLDLSHTWGDNNGENNTPPGDMAVYCGDDGVLDTPFTRGHSPGNNCIKNDIDCSSWPLNATYRFDQLNDAPVAYIDTFYLPGTATATLSPFSATGVHTPGPAGSFRYAGWPLGANDGETDLGNFTGSLSTGHYYEFTITPAFRYAAKIDSITFNVARSDNGPRTFTMRSSKNNYSTNMAPRVNRFDTDLSINGAQRVANFIADNTTATRPVVFRFDPAVDRNIWDTPWTFRFYAWNAEEASGTFSVDNVLIHGVTGIPEHVQNFMEYSYCAIESFTDGQALRMRTALESDAARRNNLFLDLTHQQTGLLDYARVCAPTADFYALRNNVCTDVPVQFRDISSSNPTSWSWTFQDGEPATSSAQHPTVRFTTGGVKRVTLTASNAQGSNTKVIEDVLLVSPGYADVQLPVAQSFNDGFPLNWYQRNYENNNSYWRWDRNAGRDRSGAMRLNASASLGDVLHDMFASPASHMKDIDELITPTMDLRWMSGAQASFWYSYASATSNMADVTERLALYWSTNCGESWVSASSAMVSGANLMTSGVKPVGAVPTLPGDWRQMVVNLPANAHTSNVRFRIVFTSGRYSNDIFVDDFMVTANGVGVEETAAQAPAISLFPNPANDQLTVDLYLPTVSGRTNIEFLDITGRTVYSEQIATNTPRLTYDLRSIGLVRGSYLVRVVHSNGQLTERLVVQ